MGECINKKSSSQSLKDYEDDFFIAMYVKSDLLHQLTPSSSIIPFY